MPWREWIGATLGVLLWACAGNEREPLPTAEGDSSGTAGAGGGKPRGPVALSFVDDHNMPPGAQLDGVTMGGLSGLWVDPATGHTWAICDDQQQLGPNRFYELDLAFDRDEITVVPASFTTFQTGSTPATEMDAEGIARTSDGQLYVASEGDTTPIVAPAISLLGPGGELHEELFVDDKFIPDESLTKGVRRNQGFEALTLSPSGKTLFTATERALVQDGPPPTFTQGNRCRIVEYDVATHSPRAEYFYATDAIPSPTAGQLGHAEIGLPELLALSDDRLLVLERATVEVDGVFTNHIRLYEVRLEGGVDFSSFPSLPVDAVPLEKRLVIDLDAILPLLEPAYPTLDNFEGMSFGPSLADGRATLLLLSDDNFNPTQRTALFAFAMSAEDGRGK